MPIVTIVPFCVGRLRSHGVAGRYIVVLGNKPHHEVGSQSCIGRSSEQMY